MDMQLSFHHTLVTDSFVQLHNIMELQVNEIFDTFQTMWSINVTRWK